MFSCLIAGFRICVRNDEVRKRLLRHFVPRNDNWIPRIREDRLVYLKIPRLMRLNMAHSHQKNPHRLLLRLCGFSVETPGIEPGSGNAVREPSTGVVGLFDFQQLTAGQHAAMPLSRVNPAVCSAAWQTARLPGFKFAGYDSRQPENLLLLFKQRARTSYRWHLIFLRSLYGVSVTPDLQVQAPAIPVETDRPRENLSFSVLRK